MPANSFLKSIVLHIFILGFFALPILKAVKREIVPSHPIPIIFDNISKDAVPQKKVAKLSKKKPSAKPKPKMKEPKKEKKTAEVKIPEKPKPVEEMKKKDFSSLLDDIEVPTKKEPQKQFDSVLKDLTPDEYKEIADEAPEEIPGSIMDKLKANFSVTEEDALRAQISGNWLVPVGAKNIEQMEVDLKITVAKGGIVTSTKVVKNKYYQKNNPAYKIFVQTAKRAILKSSPLELSKERMQMKNDIIFHFSAREMVR